ICNLKYSALHVACHVRNAFETNTPGSRCDRSSRRKALLMRQSVAVSCGLVSRTLVPCVLRNGMEPASLMPPMPRRLLIGAAIVLVLIATSLTTQLSQWELRDPSYYLFYVGVALLAFGLRVKGPSGSGQLEHSSMGFLFVIIALVGLNLRESLQIAGSAILI